MNLVAGQARNGWAFFRRRSLQLPRPAHIGWPNEIFDRPLPEHPVTPQAIVNGLLLSIVLRVEKDIRVGHGMTAAGPILEEVLVAPSATRIHGQKGFFGEPGLFERRKVNRRGGRLGCGRMRRPA